MGDLLLLTVHFYSRFTSTVTLMDEWIRVSTIEDINHDYYSSIGDLESMNDVQTRIYVL